MSESLMPEYQPKSDPGAVLASVRRIVSQNGAEVAADALVLTPAQRIDRTAEPLPAPHAASARRDRVQTRTLKAERLSLERRIAELEAAVGERGDWEPDGSEPVDNETPRAFVFSPHRTRTQDPARQPETLGPNADPAPGAPSAAVPVASTPVLLHPPVAMVEPARDPEPEPEPEPELAANGGTAGATKVAVSDAPGLEGDLTEESVIDEDALRDLVAEIVRQELQGELGERITRNVRKLVRREIHRALLTRDLG